MSTSTAKQLLTRLLIRFLKSIVSSIRASTPFGLINQLFAFFSSLGRWTRTNPRRTPHQRQSRPLIPSVTLDSGIVCAMNVPETNVDISEAVDGSGVLSHSSTTHLPGDHQPGSDLLAHPGHRPSQLHHTIDFALPVDSSTGSTHRNQLSLRAGYLSPNRYELELHQCRAPLSVNSSQLSATSCDSESSAGKTTYRKDHGPPPHGHTPTPSQDVTVFDSYPTTGSGGSAPFLRDIAPLPRVSDPTRSRNADPRVFPMSVTSLLRYDYRKTRQPSELENIIKVMSYRYPETPENIPDGWRAYLHPEGVRYFVHTESKTFTEANICEEQFYTDIERFRSFLLSSLQTQVEQRTPSEFLEVDKVQLVLEPLKDDIGPFCYYYFVNPRTRCLFWLHEWNGYEIFKDCKGVLSEPHKGNIRRHWDLYPNFCEVTEELKDEVVDMILHATCDHLTSHRSSCPLNPEQLKEYLSLVQQIDPTKTSVRKHSAIVIGRMMQIFYENYFLNYYGEDCARLNFDQRIRDWSYHPSSFMTVFAPFLFMTPVKSVRLLHRIFVDDVAGKEKWNMFVANLNSQLQETSVLATVLLNANVAFLPKQPGPGTSLQECFGYMSLAASTASIILGLTFMGHSHTDSRNTPFKAARFLQRLWHEKHGLERLAIVYSLPHVFLVWGMGLFSAAFMVQWYHLDNMGLRYGAGGPIFLIALLVAWCIWSARDLSDRWWFQPDSALGANDEEVSPMLDLFRCWVKRAKSHLSKRANNFGASAHTT